MNRSSRHGGAIKAFRSQDRMSEDDAKKVLDGLCAGIKEIHQQNVSELSFEEMYRQGYNLVLQKHGSLLYASIAEEVRDFLRNLGNITAESTTNLLSKLVDAWNTHDTTMKLIRDILMYMDRTYVVQERKEAVYDLGLRIFREEVAHHPRVKDRLLKMLLENIENERSGMLVDRQEMRHILQMEVELGVNSVSVYEEDFEQHFLQMTKRFYVQESTQLLQSCTCSEYLIKVERRLEEEQQRARAYLNFSSEEKLLRLVREVLIVTRSNQLVDMPNSGCRAMLQEGKVGDLSRMYKLFEVKNCRDIIKKCLHDFVKETGERLVEDDGGDVKPVDFVRNLLDLQEKFSNLIVEAFEGDKIFQRALKEAFEFFVNKNRKCSQFLSLYLDDLMRNKIRLQSNDELDLGKKVDQVVLLFRYLQDKDIFESHYKQQLAKRLLGGKSASVDSEMLVIKKLKTECGNLFTSKLEGMFKDIKLSKEFMDQFSAENPRAASDNSTELRVTVLTTGFWPSTSPSPCNLPTEISNICARFERFYLQLHSGRRLTWQTNLGTADVRARFSEKSTHEFNVSTFQMCILLLFNEREEISFQDILEATGISQNELKRHIISLAAPKFRVLTKGSKGRVIENSTMFSVNSSFSSSHFRVRIPLVSTRENFSGSKSSIPEEVEEDRRFLIEAAIVRIMKSRKTLEHSLLIAEVTKQMSSRFNPSPQLIKRRMESLLEREYLERDPSDHRVYRYLA